MNNLFVFNILCLYCLYICKAYIVLNEIINVEELKDYQAEADTWLKEVNSDLLNFNQLCARYTWILATNSENIDASKALKLASVKNEWKNKICSFPVKKKLLTTKQNRMLYLLCRGPRFDTDLTMNYLNVMEVMADAYNSEVCLTKEDSVHFSSLATSNQNSENIPELDTCLHGEPDLERLMKRSDLNPDQLQWIWFLWHDFVGPQIKKVYPSLVTTENLAANKNGYRDIGEAWKEELEMNDLETEVFNMYEEIKPLYLLLHAVVRHKLFLKYGPEIIKPHGLIPIHLLGNMWGQDWSSLTSLILPKVVDLDKNLKEKNWTVVDMVEQADDIFSSWGLPRMTQKFWNFSIFESQGNSSMCHGTAANLYEKHDFRMILCAQLNMDDFYVIHHEMGHIQYYMAYQNQPAIFQDGANSAFHESIGDVAMHAVMTPQHLNRLGLLSDADLLDEDINLHLLLEQALTKIPEIPFALIVDKYRWDIFNKIITERDYNKAYWMLNEKIRGITAPDYRGEEYFDAAAKFHIPDNTPYIRYFLSSILQMDIFKALCQLTVYGKIKENESFTKNLPLHRCDIYGSKKVGKKLRHVLEKGSSIKWFEALESLTGKKEITVDALLEYYDPVYSWLKNYVEKYNVFVGW